MSGSNMKFLYIGLAVAILLSVLAPFLASSDPDGLESAADDSAIVGANPHLPEILEKEPVVGSPMPDYSIEGMGKSGEVMAIAGGTLLVLGMSFGLGKIMHRKSE